MTLDDRNDLIADYRLERQIAASAHGALHLAVAAPRLGLGDTHVAVKTMQANATDDDFRRVANELRLLHAVDSDHVVELLDAGNDNGRLFIVTRYYPAGSLADPRVPVDHGLIRRCVADAALGAEALHEHGVAHRDIKPSTILIDGDRGRLAELALAEMVAGTATVNTGPIGSLEFMSPALLDGRRASRRTDLWSLGMTLHRLLTGHSPLGDVPVDSLIAACRHVLHTVPVISSTLDAATRSIVSRCLTTDEATRYRRAVDFANDLSATIPGVAR